MKCTTNFRFRKMRLEVSFTGAESEKSSGKKRKVSSKMFSQEEQDLILKYRQIPASAQKIIKEICELQISVSQ